MNLFNAKVLFIYFAFIKKIHFMIKFIKVAIIFCVLSVILGAFGAHLLIDILSEKQLNSFETAVRYQMFHGLVILTLSLNNEYFTYNLKKVLQLMSIGVVLFSLSIYLLITQDLLGFSLKFLGVITPVGGLLLIISWIGLIIIIKKNRSSTN